MSAFTSACEEVMKQKRNRMMEYGIHYYDAVRPGNLVEPKKSIGRLIPLRQPCILAGPVILDMCDKGAIKIK
jgi:hypothetical protein